MFDQRNRTQDSDGEAPLNVREAKNRPSATNVAARARTLGEVVDHLGASGTSGFIDGTEIRVRRPAAGRKDRNKFGSGRNRQNAVKTMVLTDREGRMLFCSPTRLRSCADVTTPHS
ncbi:hypothetical protein [Streptomyces sp. NPDC001537]